MPTLELSSDQLRSLAYLAAAGEFALMGHKLESNEAYVAVLHKVLKMAYEEGMTDLVHTFTDGEYELQEKHMEEIASELKESCEESFWDMLAEGLAYRDLAKKFSEAQWEAMDQYQRFEHMELEIIRYEKEFEEHGLTRLHIKK